MIRVLEDLFPGLLASPSFSQELRFRWEDSRQRVRVLSPDGRGIVLDDPLGAPVQQRYNCTGFPIVSSSCRGRA